ncbi:hypothetical protein [Pantoea sp. App145]|uniref:hypothetical protein n=1 Tax=Pantoea sp. App145 TaxID=3071567 RepID=UPI003A800AD5
MMNTLKRIHADAQLVDKLLNSAQNHDIVKDVLQEFTGNIFTEREIKLVIADYKNYVSDLRDLTVDRVRVFRERYTADDHVASGCLINEAERLLFGRGDIGFVLSGDGNRLVYMQNISEDESKQIIIDHEIRHVTNKNKAIHSPGEVYSETYNPVKKFSFAGMEYFSKQLLSNRYYLVDYLMSDRDFLRSFCQQLSVFTANVTLKRKIIKFMGEFLGGLAWRYTDRYSPEAEEKRKALKGLVEPAFKDNSFVIHFMKHNADLHVGIFSRLVKLGRQNLESKQDIDTASDQLKSMILQAGSLNSEEINVGASTSGGSIG